MARAGETTITLASRIVGRIRLDPGTIRAQGGGPADARLIVPVTVEMHSRPVDEMLALIELAGALHLDPGDPAGSRVGVPHVVRLVNGMPCRSLPDGPAPAVVEMEFPLSPVGVARLEDARRRVGPDTFALHLALTGTVAWVGRTNGEIQTGDELSPFGTSMGLHSELTVFWSTTIGTLTVGIDVSVWVANVLPGLGVDRVRVVEFTFPPSLPGVASAGARWDEACMALAHGKENDAIAACRGVIRAWSKQLGGTRQRHVADILGERTGWPPDDPRRTLLDAVWQGILNVANAPHHQEDQAVPFHASLADAQFHVMMTAIVSNYVAELSQRSPASQ
jgi:hypothetical protein